MKKAEYKERKICINYFIERKDVFTQCVILTVLQLKTGQSVDL